MAIDPKTGALRLLRGLENGTMDPSDAALLAEDLDPVLVYVIVRYLRACYPASDPAATAVLGRVVKLTSTDAALIARFKAGERDPVSQWFEHEYSYRDYRERPAELFELIVDKLES